MSTPPSCGDLSAQTHRPIVRLINVLWQRVRPNSRIVFSFASEDHMVTDWFADDTMTFGQVDEAPEVYLYREMEFTVEVRGMPVILWICDDPNLDPVSAKIMEHSDHPWSRKDQAALKLHFTRPVMDVDTNPWIPLPVDEITLTVDDLVVSPMGCADDSETVL